MKPKWMVSPIILGQPWQRQYNCRVNWKKEGILYEENDQELFEPFLGEDSYAYLDSDESEDGDSSQNILKKQLDKGKGKIEDKLMEVPTDSMKSQNKPTEGAKKPHRDHLQAKNSAKETTVEVST